MTHHLTNQVTWASANTSVATISATGLATGVADVYHEMTLGLNIRPEPWLWFRPEVRYDWAQYSHPYNYGTRSSQFTVAFDVILLF